MTQTTFSDTTLTGSDFVEHYGVKGMKWGVRRDLKKLPSKKARENYISEKDSKWKAKTEDPKRAVRTGKRASRDATRMTKQLNKKYKKMGYKLKGSSLNKRNLSNRRNKLAQSQYNIELKGVLESSLDSAAYKGYKNSPSRLYQVSLNRKTDGTLSAKVVPRKNAKLDKQRAQITNKARKLKHSDEGTSNLDIKLTEDEDGYVIDVQLPEFDLELESEMEHSSLISDTTLTGSDFLEHYGVKGMKWGVRKDKRKSPITKKHIRDASKVKDWDKHHKEQDAKQKWHNSEVAARRKRGDKSIPTEKEFQKQYKASQKKTSDKKSDDSTKPKKTPKVKRTDNEISNRFNNFTSDQKNSLNDDHEVKAAAKSVPNSAGSGNPLKRVIENHSDGFQIIDRAADRAGLPSDYTPLASLSGSGRKKRRFKHDDLSDDVKMEVPKPSTSELGYSAVEALLGNRDVLEHAGVKGMKWGVRKDKDKDVKPKTKSKYGTSTTNADGSKETYVGGVGTAGRHLTEEEQAEADKLWLEMSELNKEYDKLWDEVMAADNEYNEARGTLDDDVVAELKQKSKDVDQQFFDLEDKYVEKRDALAVYRTKAMDADAKYYKDNPDKKRPMVRMPSPGKTTYTSEADVAGSGEARFRDRKLKHDANESIEDYNAFLEHYGVKGMKWGVRKDGKKQGYQGPSKSKKKTKPSGFKKLVDEVTDPEKRAKRKLTKAQSKLKTQRTLEEASAYKRAAKESKKNSQANNEVSEQKTPEKPPTQQPKTQTRAVSANSLSDDDLSKVLNRMRLEKQYATMMEERRHKPVSEKVGKFLVSAGTEAASTVTKQLMTKALGAAVMKSTSNMFEDTKERAKAEKAKEAPKPAAPKSSTPAPTPAAPKSLTPAAPKATPPSPKTSPIKPPPFESSMFDRDDLSTKRTTINLTTPTKSPSFENILAKSYSQTRASDSTTAGKSWLSELDTNRNFMTLTDEKRKRR